MCITYNTAHVLSSVSVQCSRPLAWLIISVLSPGTILHLGSAIAFRFYDFHRRKRIYVAKIGIRLIVDVNNRKSDAQTLPTRPSNRHHVTFFVEVVSSGSHSGWTTNPAVTGSNPARCKCLFEHL